jgi:uncharacterized integral membrane protein
MMGSFFLLVALLIGLFIAGVAFINNQVVTLNYYFGQISLTLFMLILGSAVAGALVMIFFGFYRSVHKFVNTRAERRNEKEMQRRVDHLEKDKRNLKDDLGKRQSEIDDAASRASDDVRDENKKLQAELDRQKKDHENTAEKERRDLDDKNKKREADLDRRQAENEADREKVYADRS